MIKPLQDRAVLLGLRVYAEAIKLALPPAAVVL